MARPFQSVISTPRMSYYAKYLDTVHKHRTEQRLASDGSFEAWIPAMLEKWTITMLLHQEYQHDFEYYDAPSNSWADYFNELQIEEARQNTLPVQM